MEAFFQPLQRFQVRHAVRASGRSRVTERAAG